MEDGALSDILARADAGDVLFFPPGRRYLVDSVPLPVGVVVLAEGADLMKADRTPYHMFHDAAAAADGLEILGGRFHMNRQAFAPGQTVSPFFFVRTRGITLRGVEVLDGAEEGVKLYGCQDVRILHCAFRRIRNNGIQFHNPAEDGFRGSRAKEDSHGLVVHDCLFEDIDDGHEGLMDGQGVTFNSTDTRVTTRDGVVHASRFRRCIRGVWAEFGGGPGRVAGRGLRFVANRVDDSRFYGIGMVGVEDGAIVGNHVVNTGARSPDPEHTSDEVTGIVISGDDFVEGGRVLCAENRVVDDRAVRRMEYGIRVKRGGEHVIRGNTVTGATVRLIEDRTAR